MASTTPAADVTSILRQGGNPAIYREGLAARHHVDVSVIDALIAQAGQPRTVDAETIAQERLSDDRRFARTHRTATRIANHEQE